MPSYQDLPANVCPCTDDRGMIIWALLWTCDSCPVDKRRCQKED